MVEAFVDAVVTFVREHESWAAPVAFLVAFGESFCFLSLVVPGTAILAGVAALLAASGVEASVLAPAIIAAAAGGALGYATSYWIGLYFKDSIPNIWPFTTHPYLIEHGKTFFDKYGAFSVFLGHFFGPIRAVIPVVAGMFAMPHVPFQIANIASAVIWSAGVIAPSFYVVTFKTEIIAFVTAHAYLVAFVLALLAIAAAIPRAWAYGPAVLLFMGLAVILIFSNGNAYLAWLAGALGSAFADGLAYAMGRRNGTHGPASLFVTVAPDERAEAAALVDRHGLLSLLISKLRGRMRGLVPYELGARKGELPQVIAASAATSFVWSALYLLPALLARFLSD